MAAQGSSKRGVQSSARKAASSRHGTDRAPSTGPVAGAFGREGAGRRTPVTVGRLERRGAPSRPVRLRAVGPVGISNLSPAKEYQEQRRLPPRGTRKGR